jgi:KUP system potassium uptake protein
MFNAVSENSEPSLLPPVELSVKNSDLQKGSAASLMVAATGVVFGDIGTSPLYALQQCFSSTNGIPFSSDAMFGVLSMVLWAFIIVVSLKYVVFVMRADNNGEGGILALMALALKTKPKGSKNASIIIFIGIFGASMFFGDAIITPAISVLSAVAGLEVLSSELGQYVIPISLIILFLLFLLQKKGTDMVGNLFGPVMILWFLVIGLMGLYQLVQYPQVLAAINPYYAIHFLIEHSALGFIVLGAVFLVLTGAEALYADMGQFGSRSIRFAWFFLVMPCLLLNYFGQGAMLLQNPAAISNPFFLMVPKMFVFPLVILATLATVIASQAVISGAFSMTSQAVLLGFIPRMEIRHTSDKQIGQIYIPLVNWVLFLVVAGLVLTFKSADNLASAYGIAVTTTMISTTILLWFVMQYYWKWNSFLVALIVGLFLTVDSTFLVANLAKIASGGWCPLLVGATCFFFFMTWYQGKQILNQVVGKDGVRLNVYLDTLLKNPPTQVEGTAVYLNAHIDYAPISFINNVRLNHVIHKRIFFVNVTVWDVPYVKDAERITYKEMGKNIYLVRAVYGFNESPDMLEILRLTTLKIDLKFDLNQTSFFASREAITPKQLSGMSHLREEIFNWMLKNSARQSDFFKIPVNSLMEFITKVKV